MLQTLAAAVYQMKQKAADHPFYGHTASQIFKDADQHPITLLLCIADIDEQAQIFLQE